MYNKIVADQQMGKAIESVTKFAKSFKRALIVEQVAQLIKNQFEGKEILLACFTEKEINETAQMILAKI